MTRRTPGFLLCGQAAAWLGALLLFACASKGNNPVTRASSGKFFAVTADSTKFYRYGPQQGVGPDETLPRDTLMTLIRPSFGYAKVKLVTGNEGYVASEDIKPASPTLLASLNPAKPEPASTSGGQENFDVHSSEPPPPEDLPDPDLPPVNPEPSPEP